VKTSTATEGGITMGFYLLITSVVVSEVGGAEGISFDFAQDKLNSLAFPIQSGCFLEFVGSWWS
jgi:hypothetical protein